MQRRVVITGVGIVSPIGNDLKTVETSLRESRSGITHSAQFAEKGFGSQVWGMPADVPPIPDRKIARHAAQDAIWSYEAMRQAIEMAQLPPERVSNDRTGIVFGTGGPATANIVEAARINTVSGSPKRLGPHTVPKTMSSGAVANLAVAYGIRGMNVSAVAACATSAYSIGMASRFIQWGEADIMFAGGAEALDWTAANAFDAMPALSRRYNDTPEKASRTYDRDRDGFVIAGGAGVLVLESHHSAIERKAPILAELSGFGFSSDGVGMYEPSGEGAVRCMQAALKDARLTPERIEYLNSHGTSTPKGDAAELGAIRAVFGEQSPYISSTKPLSGHGLGAAGVWEAIFCILMMQSHFLAKSANIETLDPEFTDMRILDHTLRFPASKVMSNSFGFGGTNATLIFERY